MAARYIISDYKTLGDETPRINRFRTDDLAKAVERFNASAQRNIRSVVLYDTKTNEVLRCTITREPIYLVKAIEKARGESESSAIVRAATGMAKTKAAGFLIEAVVKELTGEPVHGLGGLCVAMYQASKGDTAAAVGTLAGTLGELTGSVIGEKIAGKKGSVVMGLACGVAAEAGASAAVQSLQQPNQTCTKCGGTGLVEYFSRCTNCNGYGCL